jgi:hypothetical protein
MIALVALVRVGYAYHWTGFGQAKVGGEVQSAKTLWDWMDLLVVPSVLALGGYLFTRSENSRTRKIADLQRQDDLLRAYLDGIAELLADKERPLRAPRPDGDLTTVARARTLTVLPRLDGERKRSALQFLYESGLIMKAPVVGQSGSIESPQPIIDLRGADLSGADLSAPISLMQAHLSTTKLNEANLGGALLLGANLAAADLMGANLRGASLGDADLGAADMRDADMRDADMRGAILWLADLRHASLGSADFSGADLGGADLSGARGITNEVLAAQAGSLRNTTMPDGQNFRDWSNVIQEREDRRPES